MGGLFLWAFNLSMIASWLVLAVVVARALLVRCPKWIICLMWAAVGVRLAIPFSLEGMFSLVPSSNTISRNVSTGVPFEVVTGVDIVDAPVNRAIRSCYYEGVTVPAGFFGDVMNILSLVWLAGIFAMLVYGIVSFLKLKRQVQPSLKYKDNIYYCDNVSTPFILGILKPKIYVPSGIGEEILDYVIRHEKAHLKRSDHIWKPLAFLLLSVYWFNPFVWLAYILFCRDTEKACDERGVKNTDSVFKRGYSEALVSCGIQRRNILACPLAFGEVGLKNRIKSVLNYKKPSFWIIIVSLVLCVVLLVGFLTIEKPQQIEQTGTTSGTQDEIPEELYTDENGEFFYVMKDYYLSRSELDEEKERITTCYYLFKVDKSTDVNQRAKEKYDEYMKILGDWYDKYPLSEEEILKEKERLLNQYVFFQQEDVYVAENKLEYDSTEEALETLNKAKQEYNKAVKVQELYDKKEITIDEAIEQLNIPLSKMLNEYYKNTQVATTQKTEIETTTEKMSSPVVPETTSSVKPTKPENTVEQTEAVSTTQAQDENESVDSAYRSYEKTQNGLKLTVNAPGEIGVAQEFIVYATVKNVSDNPINYALSNSGDEGIDMSISGDGKYFTNTDTYMRGFADVVSYKTLQPGEEISVSYSFCPGKPNGSSVYTSSWTYYPKGTYTGKMDFSYGGESSAKWNDKELSLSFSINVK